ncbi:hypothetical protein F5Y18DRAFT_362249 [Xylariaceae sp. FL1019]|nr:hypothetical protein F5Y18DRAFT_362249 [Xylariaceae sp. FL1019]
MMKVLENIWTDKRSNKYSLVETSEQPDNVVVHFSAPELEKGIINEPHINISEPLLSKRKRRLAAYLIPSTVWGSVIFAGITLVYLLLSIARSLWGIEDDPDKVFGNWGKPGSITEDVAWYPTDFLRDVTPVPCHSHNDYWRKVPVFSALHAGCVGIEADVWLLDDDARLYVGHDTAALTPARTFENLYINPLVELLDRNNPQTDFYNDTRRGIFDTDPDQTVVLLVDLKTDGPKTFHEIQRQLEPLRARDWLTYVQDGVVHKRQITVVGSGKMPFDELMQNSTYRDMFYDAPLDDMFEDPYTLEPAAAFDGNALHHKYNPTNSFYASVNMKKAVGVVFGGFSKQQLRIIRGQIRAAHSRGLRVRYWNTPAWPINVRNRVWRRLIKEGADILNVDDLRSATKKRW